VSILSNHFPEVLDSLNSGPPEPCCRPEQSGRLCPRCAMDYETWSREVEALPPWYDEIVAILPEPCGQQFPEEPLPADMPF
jgi:hypothetical protein